MEGINKSAISAIFSALLTACLLLFSGSVYAVGYTITTGTNGSGTVTRSPNNSLYPASSTVVVTATPATGWYFAGWSGSIGDAINPTNIFVNANFTITGNFLPLPTNTITLVTNGSGTIALSPPGGSYASNTTVTATATPATGWVFTGWSNAATGTTDPLALTLVANVSLTGTFAQLPAFDIQPQSITNLAGTTVTFTSDSVGTTPVVYQWFFGSTPLSGSTASSLTLTNVQIAQAGNYSVVATNLYGAATSSIAGLVLTNANGSTNVVNTPTDAALRAAIAAGGWVSISCNGTITLTNTITLTKNVILDASSVNLIVSGGGSNRIFYVPAGITLAATNLVVANGLVTTNVSTATADGGAVYNNGSVILTGCTVTNNSAINSSGGTGRGGAIYNAGNLSFFATSLSNNAVVGSTAEGGGIFSAGGAATIRDSTLSSNLCLYTANGGTNYACGGALYQQAGSLSLSNSILTANLAMGSTGTGYGSATNSSVYGGALTAFGGITTIDHCQFLANTAYGGAGFIGFGSFGSEGKGGAIWSTNSLTIERTVLAGNYAISGFGGPGVLPGAGGAIFNTGTAVINDSQISSNTVSSGTMNYWNQAVTQDGRPAFGGGIFNNGQLAMTNCTIALNSALGGKAYTGTGNKTAARGNAFGGGVCNWNNATLIAMNVTIASNSCSSPGYIGDYGNTISPGSVAGAQIACTNSAAQLHNTLIVFGGPGGNCYGLLADGGFNMNSDGTATFASGSSYNFTDPQLAALGNNGGPTATMALQNSSPAIGFGDTAGAPATDQRGYIRIVADGIDIGAFQYNAISTAPPFIVSPPAPQSVAVGGSISFSATVTGAAPLAYQWQFGGTNLPGATNATLMLTNVQFAQAGNYSVAVTNLLGSAQSSSAALTVKGPLLTFGWSGTNLQISFLAQPATTYHLQASTNLLSAWSDWQIIGPFGSASNVNFTLPAQTPASRFFRLRLP